MNIYLKLKAWQMFLILVFPMVLSALILRRPDSLRWFEALTLLYMLIVIGWLYAVGSTANERLPIALKKNPILYNIGFGIAIFNEALTVIYGFSHVGVSNVAPGPLPWFDYLHFASMLGLFYGLWFTAKQFVTLQKDRSVKFHDYIGPFFSFWIFPIGVWFLQPRINDIFINKRHNNSLNSGAHKERAG